MSEESKKKVNKVFSDVISGYLSQGMVLDVEEAQKSGHGLLLLDESEKTAYRILFESKRHDKKLDYFIKVLRTSNEDAFYSFIDDRWQLVKLDLCATDNI